LHGLLLSKRKNRTLTLFLIKRAYDYIAIAFHSFFLIKKNQKCKAVDFSLKIGLYHLNKKNALYQCSDGRIRLAQTVFIFLIGGKTNFLYAAKSKWYIPRLRGPQTVTALLTFMLSALGALMTT
jgi:hypothetical protein